MKILFLTRLYWPHVGGVEKHIEKVSQVLQKKGYEITILTTRYDNKLLYRDLKHGNKIIRFDQPNVKFFGLLYTWYWMIKNIDLFKQSGIVHVHDVFIWYWPIKILLPGKKVFTTIHGQWGKYPISQADRMQKKIASKYSNGTLSIGEYLPKNYGYKKDLVSYGASDKPKKFTKKDGDTVFYVGRLDKSIPVGRIFEVLKALKNKKVVIIGDGELKNEAEKYGHVTGFVYPEKYYQKAKYVFASGYLTIIEALSNKCLVLTIYENPLQEDYYKLTPFKDFIIIADKPEKLIEKFNYYTSHKKLADNMIDKGFNWARSQTWEKMSDNYIKLWQRN